MKGKNKLILILLAVIALVATGVGFAINKDVDTIGYANAEAIDGFTAKLDGNIIFSTEVVYMQAEYDDFNKKWNSNTDNRKNPIEVTGGYNFKPIATNNGIEYFGDYGLREGNGLDNSHKKVVGNGEFVMLNDQVAYKSTSGKDLKQGVMITLGGYFYKGDDVLTNAAGVWNDKDNDGVIDVGEVYAWNNSNGNTEIEISEIPYGAEMDTNDDNVIDATELTAWKSVQVGGNIDWISINATRDEQPVILPNNRDYNNSSYEDFTWFILPSAETEGHYEISIQYSMDGFSRPLEYKFDFYLLLDSMYNKQEDVNGQSYSAKPKVDNYSGGTEDAGYVFNSGTTLNYPTLTFDYYRYELKYTHTSGDETTEYHLIYEEDIQELVLYSKVFGDEDEDRYPINTDRTNTIVTLMFVDAGKYDFEFNYIYKYEGQKFVISHDEIPFKNIKLQIYGYQLKYSKSGFASADMTYLEIYQNNTMFILVNGFQNADSEEIGDNLGVNYKLIKDTTQHTGTIIDDGNNTKNSGSESAGIINTSGDIKLMSNSEIETFVADNLTDKYQRTDRGLWLTLKDEYYLTSGTSPVVLESFYYYNDKEPIDADYIKEDENRIPFEKVTTFTAPGYYLVQVKYSYELDGTRLYKTQLFAFQITATTPTLNLRTIDIGEQPVIGGGESFYAHEFTNQNVFAYWKETEIFESTIVGKLYYSSGRYASERTLKQVADGGFDASVTKEDYEKLTLLEDSSSYLLVLEVERSATKTYTYFTIDKDPIKDLKVYEVITNAVDNLAVYSIKQDANLKYIEHTSKGVIDSLFTMSWADKNSGARIDTTYCFTPFVKNTQLLNDNTIVIEQGNDTYKYIINQYTLGTRSKPIQIYKPSKLNLALDINNVLTDQGIYEFNLIDQAGNMLSYVVVVDRTAGVVNATYGDSKVKYLNGQLVADYVELEWGTHKALDLGSVAETESAAYKFINKQEIENYYVETGSNLSGLRAMFVSTDDKSLFVVRNTSTEIRLDDFDKYHDNYYILTNSGAQQIMTPSGYTLAGWDDNANYLFNNADRFGVKINVDYRNDGEDHTYRIKVKGVNHVTVDTNTEFMVRITPDETLGEVYSTSQDGGEYETLVKAKGQGTKEEIASQINMPKYYEGQASDDGRFVFEWTAPKEEDNFKVTEVKYEYYQLMDQSTLNSLNNLTKNEILSRYPYYPYKYVEISDNYILKTEEDIQTVAGYSKVTRVTRDVYGNILSSRDVNRSDAINLAYENYYNDKGELVTKQVTQTGLYIITRKIELKEENAENQQPLHYSYAFFVDRNMIVGYSVTDVTAKIVGQFIHASMPTSEDDVKVIYDNLNKQVKPTTKAYYENNEKQELTYKVYFETNRLPTQLHIPSGKYVSGKIDDMSIVATSHINLKLKLSVYFYDSYEILPNSYKGSFVKLMDNLTSTADNYIALSFSNIYDRALVSIFRDARIQADDNKLSLPGEYVFVVEDTVGLNPYGDNGPKDVNTFAFGVKLTNNPPQTDMYAYAEMNDKQSSKTYSEGTVLYTNQQYVDFVIPVEDIYSYQAQLDIASIEIWRADVNGADTRLWFRLKGSVATGLVVDLSGIEQDMSKVLFWIDKDGKIINQADTDAKDRLAGYLIKLDTGLEVVDNQIISYKEYIYSINIKYILKNSGQEYYTYKTNGQTVAFYQTQYNVTIDRTPNDTNLDILMSEQGEYFEGYHEWLAEEIGVNFEDVNQNFAYRNTTTIGDYYGLANDLYYKLIDMPGNLSNQAMYALTVNKDTLFNISGIKEVYYRQLNFDDAIVANARMGLLPINSIYGSRDYHAFREDRDAYNVYYSGSDNISYSQMLMGKSNADGYANNWGRYYEVVEKDMAGNYTQYVVYFGNPNGINISITLNGDLIGGTADDDEYEYTFNNKENAEQPAFIGIDSIEEISGIVGKSSVDDDRKINPYYANINIYDASRNKIKTIYTNSISTHDGDARFEQQIFETIKNEGNYILEFIDVFGVKKYITINNYTSGEHKLSTGNLVRQTDYQTGQNYIKLSGVNTKIDNTYWYVTKVEITYLGKTIRYTSSVPNENEISVLTYDQTSAEEGDVVRDLVEQDRLNLKDNIQYLVKLYDVAKKEYLVPISTTEGYYAYRLNLPDNKYSADNVYYTANKVTLSYNTDLYNWQIKVKEDDGEWGVYTSKDDNYITEKTERDKYKLVTLVPNDATEPANAYGSLRIFEVRLKLNEEDDFPTEANYTVYIDTRATSFIVENTNKEDRIDYIKSTLKNGDEEGENYEDYNIMDLIQSKYYGKLLSETVNISWTRFTSDYFIYNYELFEFVTKDECVNLLRGTSVDEYSISPKENTTGKYIFKVTIEGKNGTWIATRIFAIYMSTTISGLYEVKDGVGNAYDYSSITNLDEIVNSICHDTSAVAKALGFVMADEITADIALMNSTFNSFGRKTAIPVYIANTELSLHSNKDNGVDNEYYQVNGSYATIRFYRVFRSNYLTFAVIIEVYPTDRAQNILNVLSFSTRANQDAESLLNNGVAKTIYDANADFYKLTFNSYNINTANNPLERHNKIIIDVYYNNVFAKRVKGGEGPTTPIEFKNSGTYKLEISDEAGNRQYFSNNTTYMDSFTVVVMRDMLYTINGEAPIPYAYYDSDVTLQINRYNTATGKNNYDINTINVSVTRNSKSYTGYEHPTESSTYIFREYGTYLVKMSANLIGTDIKVESQLVFTILNPNEARKAIDFTSIHGYNIISVFNITKTAERDVTDKFMELLQDKANNGEINVYNKLITYERLVDIFGNSTQGKMKFRVLYEVQNDDLLPARIAEFSFTLNNETATINSSIEPGGKTTSEVSLKFNGANIYDQVGDCNLVINGEIALRIDENSSNSITEIKVTEVGQYYIQLMGDSGSVVYSFNFTIKEPLNTVAIILIVVIALIVIGLIGTFIWLRTRMKVR